MSDSDSQSPPPEREGFERRWIKGENYTGPERRSGGERRRRPPTKKPMWPVTNSAKEKDSAEKTESTEEISSAKETNSAKETPPVPVPPGKFKPYRP